MELSSHQEGQTPISIPIPINSTPYGAGGHGHGHMIHHHHHEPAALHNHTLIHNNHSNHLITSSAPPVAPPQNHIPAASITNNGSSIPTVTSPDQEEEEEEDEEHVNHVNVAYNHHNSNSNSNKKVVNSSIKYKECLKNHAAAMGGTATDGCGEFMPSGEEGTIEALTCSACNCHRNFHRKEIEGDLGTMSSWDINSNTTRVGRKVLLGHPNGHKNMSIVAADALGFHTAVNPTGGFLPSRTAPHHHPHHHPHQMIMSYNNNMGLGGLMGSHLPSESDEQEQDQIHHHGHGGGVNVASRAPGQLVKKRFRTKFTQDQKEKMFNFAEKVGWKIQKQEESVVQSFCHEIGVKRRVLKVWMHNNKHNLAKNKSQPPT
ncbi:zinc-finger homeodomain protein 3-like [Argentina anserina]|uniref:zinc-finger homeodomain protein 3-like n=1 Tax=Argentina anserina TaxID=57926 RepID=UPI00217621E4|nr:zinc-finger homeodomain protein 3-like [Potentilla anserina]